MTDSSPLAGRSRSTPGQEGVPGRPDWDEYFMAIAAAVATRADCRRRRVGAVIVSSDRRVVSTGYNGAPSGHPGCLDGHCPRGLLSYEQAREFTDYDTGPGRCVAVHAEANALLYARTDCRGATAYVTAKPCPTCRKLLAGAGIERVLYPAADGPDGAVDSDDLRAPSV